MSATTVRAAIENAAADVMVLHRAKGRAACETENWTERAEAHVEEIGMLSSERRQYVETYAIAAASAMGMLREFN
jgi:hypothetical protein